MKKILVSVLLASLAAAPGLGYAAPRPDLYPNQHLKQVGSQRADRDVNECSVNATDYLSSSGGSGSKAGRTAVKGAARGAALGALGATIMKESAGRGAGAGAAIGGIKGLSSANQERKNGSPEYRSYVEACLEDRGYKVVGWKQG